MADADIPSQSGNVGVRVIVGGVLIVVAGAAVWFGGLAFTSLVAAAVLLMSAEWCVMHRIGRGFRLACLATLAFVGVLAADGPPLQAVVVLAAAAGLLGLFARGYDRQRAFWLAAGLLYCGLPMVALIWLRQLPQLGVALAIAVFAIVWATDIGSYFVGRAAGGARLAPSISPGKTWSGALGGIVAAMITGGVLARLSAGRSIEGDTSKSVTLAVFVFMALMLSMIAIGGDLFESWLKRRAGVKDSGTLLPGHGGVMDRLDGLVPVAVVAAIIVAVTGVAR